jgi:hypothetical protein
LARNLQEIEYEKDYSHNDNYDGCSA